MRTVRPETYERIDNRLYDEGCDSWWEPDSWFYQLKAAVNPARVGYARRKLFDELHLDPRGKKALEVGCGGGLLCEEIARMGFDVTGVDPSEPSLEVAIRHARANGLDIRYARAAGESLPYPDESFDVVLCCDVLEHVRDLPQVIAEVSRVLKPGGPFIYDTLNRTWLSKLVAIKIVQEWKPWAFMPPRLHVWKMFITPREMKSVLRRHHLEWKEHRGLKPGINLVSALAALRQRARGACSYAALGERVKLVESRVTAVMYLGCAVKRRARVGGGSLTEERDV
jgi:2-polyprenyl-6-hydroxyphenyl methylase / 3-demethylubiquinone-9 3-methyltransferase